MPVSPHSSEHSHTGVFLYLSYTNATWNVVAKIYRTLEVVFRVGGTVQAMKSKLLRGFFFSYSWRKSSLAKCHLQQGFPCELSPPPLAVVSVTSSVTPIMLPRCLPVKLMLYLCLECKKYSVCSSNESWNGKVSWDPRNPSRDGNSWRWCWVPVMRKRSNGQSMCSNV